MSLLDVFITSPVKALVLVDTEVRGQEDGAYFEGTKMFALPHANVVLAGRGHNLMLNTMMSIAHVTRGDAFDELEAAMPAMLAQAIGYLKTVEFAFATSIHEQEIVLVGYSQSRGAMHVAAFISKTEAVGFVKTDCDDTYVSPWHPSWGEPFQVSKPEQARFIATMQTDNGLALHPDAPLGGRLLLAEVTQDEIRFSAIARLTERNAASGAKAISA